jgi:hypothetical protein
MRASAVHVFDWGETLSAKNYWSRHLHYWISALLAMAVVPLLRHFQLPRRFDWPGLVRLYWLLLAERAIFAALILFLIGFPPTSWLPVFRRLWRDKLRLVILLIFSSLLSWAYGWAQGLLLTIDATAIVEVSGRRDRRLAINILLPAIYLFNGLLLVSAYNDIILSSRYFSAADQMFYSIDQWLLGGLTVSRISHWALRNLPMWSFRFLEFVYFGLFTQIGAALILTTADGGRKRGLQFVGTILSAYYLALVLFYLWPSQGPYYLCPTHFSEFPMALKTYAAQLGSIAGAQARSNHEPLKLIAFDYYIAFPCMHICQPLIVMWFLWSRKRIIAFLAVYNSVLLAAIVLLEWHYIVDLLAGFAVAAAAIVLSGNSIAWSSTNGVAAEPLNARMQSSST